MNYTSAINRLNRQIRELKSEGHKSLDSYVSVRPSIHKLERRRQELEEQMLKDQERER